MELKLNELPLDVSYKVYDLTGKVISNGVTNSNTIRTLPTNGVYLLQLKGYKSKKFYIKQ